MLRKYRKNIWFLGFGNRTLGHRYCGWVLEHSFRTRRRRLPIKFSVNVWMNTYIIINVYYFCTPLLCICTYHIRHHDVIHILSIWLLVSECHFIITYEDGTTAVYMLCAVRYIALRELHTIRINNNITVSCNELLLFCYYCFVSMRREREQYNIIYEILFKRI